LISIAVLASHSALDVLDGAKDEGLKTIAVAKVGRDRAYKEFPVVDKLIVLKEYNEILRKDVIEELIGGDDLLKKVRRLAEKGVTRLEDLESASIEELVIGAHFSVNYFNSRIRKRLELHSFDRRIQNNLDGILRLPAREQLGLELEESYVEVGHEPATIRESLLESIFEIGYRFVETCSKLVPLGIIGSFSLQLIITSDLDLVVYDVSTRIGGGTNAYMGVGSRYSKLYFRRPISIGRRIAIELREAWDQGRLDEVVT
jgi:5-formaminoimidazole-4-carboxamide-1-(beta)-D-ribofuranosyl 5'-monophosphate synthetase